jgi:hypothetical protein
LDFLSIKNSLKGRKNLALYQTYPARLAINPTSEDFTSALKPGRIFSQFAGHLLFADISLSLGS